MKRKEHKKKRLTRKERRWRCISAILAVIIVTVLVYQAISGIVTVNWTGGLNYFGQPVDPALQLIVVLVLAFVGTVSAWQFFFGKKETKKEKDKRKKGQEYRYPHQKFPWRQ